MSELGRLDVLANVAGDQHPQRNLEDISGEQLQKTFQTNILGMFYLVKAALPHLKPGSAIVNTASVRRITAHRSGGLRRNQRCHRRRPRGRSPRCWWTVACA